MVLKRAPSYSIDVLKLYEDEEFVSVVDVDVFSRTSLHLLQLTRAAIFSYVYCVRLETIVVPNSDIENNFKIGFK